MKYSLRNLASLIEIQTNSIIQIVKIAEGRQLTFAEHTKARNAVRATTNYAMALTAEQISVQMERTKLKGKKTK